MVVLRYVWRIRAVVTFADVILCAADLVLGRPSLGRYTHLHVLYADLDMHRGVAVVLLHGWISCVSLAESAAQLLHHQEQRGCWHVRPCELDTCT